jgi:hypothetical protein
MNSKRQALVGWALAEIGARMLRRKIARNKRMIAENRAKIGAAGVIALVLIGGVVAAKAGSGDD